MCTHKHGNWEENLRQAGGEAGQVVRRQGYALHSLTSHVLAAPAFHCPCCPALPPAAGQHSKLLVRGDSRAAYHNHIMQASAAELRAVVPDARLQLTTLGESKLWCCGGSVSMWQDKRCFWQLSRWSILDNGG